MNLLTAFSLALGITGTISSIVLGCVALRRNNKADDSNEGRQTGTILSDIGYIKSGVDDIKRKQEKQDDFNIALKTEITKAQDSAASAHRRIDGLEERLNH